MKSSIFPIAASFALIGVVTAQEPRPQQDPNNYKPEEVIKKFDKNSDSKLDLTEFSAMKKFSKAPDPAVAAKKAFEESDVNKDGAITAEELKIAHVARTKAGEAKKTDAKPDVKTEPVKPGSKPEIEKPAAK